MRLLDKYAARAIVILIAGLGAVLAVAYLIMHLKITGFLP